MFPYQERCSVPNDDEVNDEVSLSDSSLSSRHAHDSFKSRQTSCNTQERQEGL